MNETELYNNWLTGESRLFGESEILQNNWPYLLNRYFTNPVVRQLLNTCEYFLSWEEEELVQQICKEYTIEAGFNYLGSGSESIVVYDQPTSLAVALRFDYYSHQAAHWQYHSRKILRTLFPQNIGEFHAVISAPYNAPSGTIRKLIHPASKISPAYAVSSFSPILDTIADLELPMSLDVATYGNVLMSNQNLIYIDELLKTGNEWNMRKVNRFMTYHGYPPEAISTVNDSYLYLMSD